jgi:hypothetical protein
MTNLQNYLFRVYNKFRIVTLDNEQKLSAKVQVLNKYKMNDLIKLLVFGRIEGNDYYGKDTEAKLALSSLLSMQGDGSVSPMAVSLISNRPNSPVFRVDLGYLLLGPKNAQKYKVSLDTFMWILIFYSSRDYINIRQNLIEAVDKLIKYCETNDGSIILERFPKINEDKENLKAVIQNAKNESHVTKPSDFCHVINSIGTELSKYIETEGSKILMDSKIESKSMGGGSETKDGHLAYILNAMFEIFKAGYYPASISSVLPDTIFTTMDIPGAGDVSGLADYLLTLNGLEYFNEVNIKDFDTRDKRVVRVVLKGTYATKCILSESYERWSHIEKRLPGAWKLFNIIYNRLRNGEYDTSEYKFSTYRFPFLSKDSDEDIVEMARVSWLTLFSSFIMGHVLNLIGQRNAEHLYKVAVPVVRVSQEDIYLVPENLYDLQNVVVKYDLADQTELRPTFLGKWLKYKADDYYTSLSNNPTGGVGYNARYSILMTEQSDSLPKEVNITASESNVEQWQEVVEGKVEIDSAGTMQALNLFFYDDDGKRIDIAKIEPTQSEGGNLIEPKELRVSKVINKDTEQE